MREQARLLEYVTDLAIVHRPRYPVVLPDLVRNREAARRPTLEPGDAAQERRLARTGLTEHARDALHRNVGIHVQRKTAALQPVAHGNVPVHRDRLSSRRFARNMDSITRNANTTRIIDIWCALA